MKAFVTGATGFIGSAVVRDLLDAGHEVTGLARSDEGAAKLEAAGAQVVRGTLDDVDVLQAAAAASGGVIHTAYKHDLAFTGGFMEAAASDAVTVEALGAALAGTDKPLVIASGVAGLAAAGPLATEEDQPAPNSPGAARQGSTDAALAYASKGVRSSVVRLPPSVHGDRDAHGFVPTIIGIAREKGVSATVGEGTNRWPAVHCLDAARVFRLAFESAPAGTILHAVGDEGVATRDIAAVIGRQLDVPVTQVSPEEADEHFGWMGAFFPLDAPASSVATQELLGWKPEHIGLLEDLELGHYFAR